MKNTLKVAMLFGFTTGAIGMAFGAEPAKVKTSDADGVQQAIRFERSKDAAAARQARMEGKTSRTAVPKPAAKAEGNALAADGSVQAAIRFEQAKAAADSRQARIESAQAGKPVRTTVTASRR